MHNFTIRLLIWTLACDDDDQWRQLQIRLCRTLLVIHHCSVKEDLHQNLVIRLRCMRDLARWMVHRNVCNDILHEQGKVQMCQTTTTKHT
jgi:hypothetical protein